MAKGSDSAPFLASEHHAPAPKVLTSNVDLKEGKPSMSSVDHIVGIPGGFGVQPGSASTSPVKGMGYGDSKVSHPGDRVSVSYGK